jgi:hypothetical protein
MSPSADGAYILIHRMGESTRTWTLILTWPTPNAKKNRAKQNSKRKRTKKSKKNIIDFQKEDEKRTKKKKSKLCQKVAKKVDKKLSKSCQKVVKKFVLNLETRLDVKHCGSKANS